MLKNKFINLCKTFCTNSELINSLWIDIETRYSHPSRHYHTLEHLEFIYKELSGFKLSNSLEFAIFFHDIIYSVKSGKNEENSAIYAQKILSKLYVSKNIISEVSNIIIDTKDHIPRNNTSKLLLDADLAHLAKDYIDYKKDSAKIRKEYSIFDDETFYNGRVKILKSFLLKDKIYTLPYFYNKYEVKARENILKEINTYCI